MILDLCVDFRSGVIVMRDALKVHHRMFLHDNGTKFYFFDIEMAEI